MDKIKSESKKMYESLEGIISEYSTLLQAINDFETKWAVTLIPNGNLLPSVKEVKDLLECLKPQIMRVTKKFIVFGRTSVGKSIFINALLNKNILPSDFGSTSKTFVEIKASAKTYNYLLVDGSNQEHPIEEMSNLNDQIANENLADRPHIHLFYDREQCELLNDEVVILDTPGVDIDGFMDIRVEDLCKESDVIILLVNATGTLSLSDKAVISKYKRIFSKLTVLIVYTWWDIVHGADSNGSTKEKHKQNAKTFLCDELNYSEGMALSNIYFLSAKERLEMVSQDSNNELRRERNRDFDAFFQDLKRKLSENAVERIHRHLEEVHSEISRIIQDSQSYLNEKCLVKELNRKIQLNLPNLNDINRKINEEILNILTKGFQELIEKGRDAVKIENEKENNPRYKMLTDMDNEDESKTRLKTLFVEIVERSLDEIKCQIIKIFADENEEIYSRRKQILQELYFPKYLNMKDQLDSFDMTSLEKNLLEINKKIKTGTISTICATAGFGLLSVVTGGASLVALGAAEIGLAVGAAIGAGGVAGSTVGGGTSFGIIRAIKNPFSIFWKKHQTDIFTQCDVFKSALLDSYSAFINNLDTDVLQLFTPILADFTNIENKVNAFKEELKLFMNISLIL